MKKKMILYFYKFLRSLKEAAPVILFFLLSFTAVVWLFGFSYVMIVSIITVFFKIRYKRNNNTFVRYIRLLAVGSILILLAYLSSKDLAACLLLNLCVPFVLVFTQSSQFNPKGYFSYAMIFAFTSLMPPKDWAGLWTEFMAFWLCVFLLAASITLWGWIFSSPAPKTNMAEQIILELSELMLLLYQPQKQKELEERFLRLSQNFHQLSYHRNFFSVQTKENQRYDMLSALIQRFSYLTADQEWRKELEEEHILTMKKISEFLKEVVTKKDSEQQLEENARELLRNMSVPEGRIRIFCRSLLHMMILILQKADVSASTNHLIYKIDFGELMYQIRFRCTPETFEMRFAMRLSIVMTVSCGLSYLLPVTHAYWIPLNAFLLLQPSFEESSYRMKTRPIGTLIGCLLEFFIHPFLPGLAGQIIFALIMISFMYCAIPGTWYHPIFSTCYALTLAAMTMNEETAIKLRLLYLGAAVIIVFIVNQFFFPMRKEIQFQYNFKMLFRLHNDYWNIIRRGLSHLTNLSVSCEILTHFHMIYEECMGYLKQNPKIPHREELSHVLLILWHMFSELEQMHYLVRIKEFSREEQMALVKLICAVQEDLYPIIAYDNLRILQAELKDQEEEVVYVLIEYLKRAESLLQYQECIPFLQ